MFHALGNKMNLAIGRRAASTLFQRLPFKEALLGWADGGWLPRTHQNSLERTLVFLSGHGGFRSSIFFSCTLVMPEREAAILRFTRDGFVHEARQTQRDIVAGVGLSQSAIARQSGADNPGFSLDSCGRAKC